MKTNECIWILEDEAGCRFVYEQVLGIRYPVIFFEKLSDFNAAIQNLSIPRPQLVIADLCLSDGFFLNVGKERRLQDELPAVAFIVVSSLDDLDVLRHCFECGAHDYLTKPFQKSELVVKVERTLAAQSYLPKLQKNAALHESIFSQLTLKEQKIFNLFVMARDRQVCKSDILNQIWGDTKIDPKTVDVHLYNLRKKLESHGIEIKLTGSSSWAMLDNRVNEPRSY